jgi:hypothetical protein
MPECSSNSNGPRRLPIRLVDDISGRPVGIIHVPLMPGSTGGPHTEPDAADWEVAMAMADYWISTATPWEVVDYADAHTIIVAPGPDPEEPTAPDDSGPVLVLVALDRAALS